MPGSNCGEVVEDPLEILDRRLEEKSHARRVVDADGAVQVAAVGDVHKDQVQGLSMMALEAVELTGFVVKPPHPETVFPRYRLASEETRVSVRSAPGAVLDQKYFAPHAPSWRKEPTPCRCYRMNCSCFLTPLIYQYLARLLSWKTRHLLRGPGSGAWSIFCFLLSGFYNAVKEHSPTPCTQILYQIGRRGLPPRGGVRTELCIMERYLLRKFMVAE